VNLKLSLVMLFFILGSTSSWAVDWSEFNDVPPGTSTAAAASVADGSTDIILRLKLRRSVKRQAKESCEQKGYANYAMIKLVSDCAGRRFHHCEAKGAYECY